MELMNVLLAPKMVKPFIILSSVAFACLAIPPVHNHNNELYVPESKFSRIGRSAESETTTEYNVHYDDHFNPESHPNWQLLAPKNNCRFTNGPRIIGGSEVVIGSYPWIARIALEVVEKTNKSSPLIFGCGAVLINEYYVLTAAHCAKKSYEIKFVRFGEHNTLTNPDCQVRDGKEVCAPPVQDIKVTRVLSHENFTNDQNLKNDIALLKLESTPVLNPFVQPACLPFREGMRMNFESEETTVAGWGLTEKNTTSNVLLAVTLKGFDSKTCRRIYEEKKVDINYTDGQMCAGGTIGKSACYGDSGGPLMYTGTFDPEKGDMTYVIGLVSMGPGVCGVDEKPIIFSRTSFFMKWILDNIGE